MQLILAIDSDPRRSEQLASLVRTRLTVDLVQATSAGEGLHALQDRIPDLILTSPLLSPFDEGVLDEYLRDLGAAGAHVQTVRIPVLSAGPKKKALVNRLFRLGRTKPTSAATPDGCDPNVFADEIAVYLSRATGARQSVAAVVEALTEAGLRVEHAGDGEEALARVRQNSYDVVICDLKMPRVDGMMLYRAIAAGTPSLARRVIFVTGDVAGPDAERFLEESGCRWLAKPFRLGDLLRSVREALA